MPKYTMEDGRSFTSYVSNCALNEMLQKKYNIKNSHEFRYYLQANADTIKKDLYDIDGQVCEVCPICKKAMEYNPN
jgi:hypothetical protein